MPSNFRVVWITCRTRGEGEIEQRDDGILIFDGVCNLCNWLVRFIIARDEQGRVRFASLQSPIAQSLLTEHYGVDYGVHYTMDAKTVFFLQNNRVYTQSTAVLKVARNLDGAWPLLYALKVVPVSLRDMVYRLVARNRYRWFGKRGQCMVPTENLRGRFLHE